MMKRLLALMLCGLALSLAACAGQGNGSASRGFTAQPSVTAQLTDAAQPSATAVPANTVQPLAEYRKITADQARAKMTGGEPFVLLDVRAQSEYDDEHIDGAKLIPDGEIAARAPTELPDKAATILVYCRSGRRSAIVAHQLVDMGYVQVYDFGGIIDWPYETVSAAGK